MKTYEFLMKTYESFKSGKKFKVYAGRDWELNNELNQLLWYKLWCKWILEAMKKKSKSSEFKVECWEEKRDMSKLIDLEKLFAEKEEGK